MESQPQLITPESPPVRSDYASRWTIAPHFFVDSTDVLKVSLYNAVSGAKFSGYARLILDDGTVDTIEQVLNTDSVRGNQVTLMPLRKGALISVGVVCTSGTPRRGQAYAEVDLQATLPDYVVLVPPLARGYITVNAGLVWPGGVNPDSVEGPGMLRSITGSAPSAGADIVITAPAGVRWILRGITALLTTSATVATRVPSLIIDDGANTLLAFPYAAGQAASLAYTYFWAPYAYAIGLVGTNVYQPIPNPVPIFQAWRIRTSTASIQAADQWGAPQYLVEEWIEP